MKVTLYGAAGDVTGSAYHLEAKKSSILIDFGMFQGGKKADEKNKKFPPVNVKEVNAVILTHAHLDHTGRLPLLVRAGYKNPIYASPATCEIAALILRDSAKVQMLDTERENRQRRRTGKSLLSPLYTQEEAEKTIKLFSPINYETFLKVAPNFSVRSVEAGHILGSSSLEVLVEEEDHKKTVIFSGDLGPHGMAILKDPETFTKADAVFMESTYGDRDHRTLSETLRQAEQIIRQAVKEGGKILVPAFAVGRTQQLLYHIAEATSRSEIPQIPIYLDSPMAIEATKIYMKHTELFDKEADKMSRSGALKRAMDKIIPCETPDESRALNYVEGPCMIIAGSGMCNAGRILHHLRHNLWLPNTHVIIAGYQAEGTLGRKLVEGTNTVKIFGEKILVKAQIHLLGGLSAHAGQSDLLAWFSSLVPSNPKLYLTHGEGKGRDALAEIIEKRFGIRAELPVLGDVVRI